ncbi:MAG: DUF262 domain-containing HNH endonuclease family protein [Bacteroidales bacterium]|nr:DUF262 domain-containing HNH endonuclease family protein [Bacteroidales bacterium]
MNATITLRDYIEDKGKGKVFTIPNYQRGYVWGKKTKESDKKDAVHYILEESLIPGFLNQIPVFIQGITVCEKHNEIILIDGQQRTTFFYLLLKYLGYEGKFQINYEIREESNSFFSSENLLNDFSENIEEEFQDIHFFKKTLRIIDSIIGEKCKNKYQFKLNFLNYLLNNVRFMYIDIPEDKATKVFSMMNGSKAQMKNEELIKAELLRLASLNTPDFYRKSDFEKHAIEWDNNMLRSRYAREWDKWLQWWNRNDVKKLYKHSNVMGYLVSSYLNTKKQEELSFENFKNQFLNEQKSINAKQTFDGLRRLQKRFEDAFNNSKVYNWVGAILRIGKNQDKFIQWYFAAESKPSDTDLENYYKWSFLGLTHDEIETHKKALSGDEKAKEKDVFDEKYDALYAELDSNKLYNEYKESAFHLLLRLNIDEDNKQNQGEGRVFDFAIWDGNRSLEHIYPKSKVWYETIDPNGNTLYYTGDGTEQKDPNFDATYIKRDTCKVLIDNDEYVASEHSIGNLVLLYGKNNSSFGNETFDKKKQKFFEPSEKEIFESRHLLHTIYKFAQSQWTGEQIAKNKYQTLKEFKEYYGKQN